MPPAASLRGESLIPGSRRWAEPNAPGASPARPRSVAVRAQEKRPVGRALGNERSTALRDPLLDGLHRLAALAVADARDLERAAPVSLYGAGIEASLA